jgi:hypothetical protein
MTVEQQLRPTLLRWQVKDRIYELRDIQTFIPYHIRILMQGGPVTRRQFHYLQRWYTRALDLSIDEIRECIDMVDMDELKGFAVERIMNEPQSDDHDDDASSTKSESSAAKVSPTPSQDDLEALCQADEEIMTTMGFSTKEELEDYLSENVPTYSAPTVRIPSVERGRGRSREKTDAAEQKQYDESGFHIVEDDEMDAEVDDNESGFYVVEDDEMDGEEDYDEIALTRTSTSNFSWADDVEEAIEEGKLPSLGSSLGSNSDSSTSNTDSTRSSSDFSDLDPSLRLRQRSPSPEYYDIGDIPLSDDLRAILVEIGGDPDTKRPQGVTVMCADEVAQIEYEWEEALGTTLYQVYRSLGSPAEDPEETELLDRWDSTYEQRYWQTEGLFMCRLTELLYKNIFEDARKAYWADRNRWKKESEKEVPEAKRRGSPLKNQIPL